MWQSSASDAKLFPLEFHLIAFSSAFIDLSRKMNQFRTIDFGELKIKNFVCTRRSLIIQMHWLFANGIKNLIKRIFCSVNQNRLGLPNVCTITNKRLMMNVNYELGLHLSKNCFCKKTFPRVESPPFSHSSSENRWKQKLSRKMRQISFIRK